MAGVTVWIEAARPRTLPAAATPVIVGGAIAAAQDQLLWAPTVLALVCALLLQIGANFANDVFDHEKGADQGDRLGPRRAVQAGLVSPRAMKVATTVVLGGALAAGIATL